MRWVVEIRYIGGSFGRTSCSSQADAENHVRDLLTNPYVALAVARQGASA